MRGEPQPGRLHPVRRVLQVVNRWLYEVIEPRVAARLVPDEGEYIVDEVSHHWVVYLPRMLEGLLTVLLLLLADALPRRAALVAVLAALVVLVRALAKALASFVDRFVITNLRVFRSWGLVSQQLATMPLQRILDISVVKPVAGRVLDYGHFVFESAAKDQGLREIRFVPRPFDRDLTMQRVIQSAGLRRARSSPAIAGGDGDGSEPLVEPEESGRTGATVPPEPPRLSTEPPYRPRPSGEPADHGAP